MFNDGSSSSETNNGCYALKQVVTALARNEGDLLADGRFTGLPLHPLPDLRFAAGVGEDDEMLERALGDLALDLAAESGIAGCCCLRWSRTRRRRTRSSPRRA